MGRRFIRIHRYRLGFGFSIVVVARIGYLRWYRLGRTGWIHGDDCSEVKILTADL
jgi:hypothetical protein